MWCRIWLGWLGLERWGVDWWGIGGTGMRWYEFEWVRSIHGRNDGDPIMSRWARGWTFQCDYFELTGEWAVPANWITNAVPSITAFLTVSLRFILSLENIQGIVGQSRWRTCVSSWNVNVMFFRASECVWVEASRSQNGPSHVATRQIGSRLVSVCLRSLSQSSVAIQNELTVLFVIRHSVCEMLIPAFVMIRHVARIIGTIVVWNLILLPICRIPSVAIVFRVWHFHCQCHQIRLTMICSVVKSDRQIHAMKIK